MFISKLYVYIYMYCLYFEQQSGHQQSGYVPVLLQQHFATVFPFLWSHPRVTETDFVVCPDTGTPKS